MPQLLGEALVESECSGLGTTIGGQLANGGEAGNTRDSDDVAMILLDHSGHELFHRPVVRKRVDLQGEANMFLGRIQNSFAESNASVVDQNGRVAMLLPNLISNFFHNGRRCDIGAVEVCIGSCKNSQLVCRQRASFSTYAVQKLDLVYPR